MYLHIFLFKWADVATPELRTRAARDIAAFENVIPGLVSLSLGENRADNNGGYQFGGFMRFTDEAAYRAYADHPAHAALLEYLLPCVEAIELDLVEVV